MFAIATGTTIICSLGRQYGTMLSLSFLDRCLRYTTNYTITNLDSVIDITSKPHSLLSLLIKALALLLIRLYLSKASQASLLGLNDFCIYFLVLIDL
jgi:hypothetical protein